jgi:hypothetical protein
LATSTKIIEFSPVGRLPTQLGSETPASRIEAGHPKPPVTVTAVETPVDDREDWTIAAHPREYSGARLSQSELYPVRQAYSREHLAALRLLTIATGRCKRALDAIATNDMLAADIEIQKIQVVLPELFCCRVLGDGFGTIVNALMSAFETLSGNTPDVIQIRTMNQVLQLLKEKPFLSADEADEQVEKMESVGLSPYPPELVEFLASE